VRPVYFLKVCAEPGVDDVRALRGWLKVGLRRFGLKVIGISTEKERVMDMRNYTAKYIKPDQVRDGPIQTRILNVFESERYSRPVLELETGAQFTLNDGNTSALIKAWGPESDDWIGLEVELFPGTYKDWNADPIVDRETVKVRAVSPAKTAADNNGAKPAPRPLPPSRVTATATRKDDLNDEIPF
jgi:hypothetical protein